MHETDSNEARARHFFDVEVRFELLESAVLLEPGELGVTSLASTSFNSFITCQARTSELSTANCVCRVMLKSSGSEPASEEAPPGPTDKALVSCLSISSFDSALNCGVIKKQTTPAAVSIAIVQE